MGVVLSYAFLWLELMAVGGSQDPRLTRWVLLPPCVQCISEVASITPRGDRSHSKIFLIFENGCFARPAISIGARRSHTRERVCYHINFIVTTIAAQQKLNVLFHDTT